MSDSESDDGVPRTHVGWLLLGLARARGPASTTPPPVFLALDRGRTVLKSDDGCVWRV